MNARSETVGEERSFSGPRKKSQLCLIPAAAVYEPNYEAGPKSTRYRIWLPDEPAFGIAGLWRGWGTRWSHPGIAQMMNTSYSSASCSRARSAREGW
ncbi:SOS response-associated peptidase family protein [Cupriavidus necator]